MAAADDPWNLQQLPIIFIYRKPGIRPVKIAPVSVSVFACIILTAAIPAFGQGSVDDGETAAATTKNVLIITAEFPDFPRALPMKTSDVQAKLQYAEDIQDFYRVQSYGKLHLNVTVTPDWVTLPKDSSGYPVLNYVIQKKYIIDSQVAYDAVSAAGVNPKDYDIIAVVLTRSEQQLTPHATQIEVSQEPREYMPVAMAMLSPDDNLSITLRTMNHEIGHTLGLPDLYYPYGQTLATPWDIMGGGETFSSWSRMKLGWLESDHVQIVRFGEKATVDIDPISQAPDGISAVKVPVSFGHYYLIESREEAGLPAGIVVMEVDEMNRYDDLKRFVQWIDSSTMRPVAESETMQRAVVRDGGSLSIPALGKVMVTSDSGSGRVVEIDRSSVSEEGLPESEKTFASVNSGAYRYDYISGDTVSFELRAWKGEESPRLYQGDEVEYVLKQVAGPSVTLDYSIPIYQQFKAPDVWTVTDLEFEFFARSDFGQTETQKIVVTVTPFFLSFITSPVMLMILVAAGILASFVVVFKQAIKKPKNAPTSE